MSKGPTTAITETVSAFYQLKRHGKFDDAWNYERMSTDNDENRRGNNRKKYVTKSSTGMPLKDFEIITIGEEESGAGGLTPVKIKLVTD